MAESIGAYARSIGQLIAEQRVLDELRTELRKPVPVVRKAIRSRALDTLPKGGGLNKWAAAIQIKAKQEVIGKVVRVKLTGGRNSNGGRSDIKRMDKGNVRHPAWGRRGKGQWSLIVVEPGFFTKPVTETDEWSAAADRALDRALDRIR
ncbi:hypothetical protein AB0J83_41455 [Actinoplanes sp. NPDC049596]|uniref:hypothetical protein n=1 Tax=unclassified Actinoplanes TaxID=2626549 RepID=UPI00342606F8